MYSNTFGLDEGGYAPGSKQVGQVSSSDPDGGTYGSRIYSIAPGYGDYSSFSVTSDGRILTQTDYDYESKSSYSILVKVTDGGGAWDWAWQTINISNVNETPYLSSYSVDYMWTNYYGTDGEWPDDTYYARLYFGDPDGDA